MAERANGSNGKPTRRAELTRAYVERGTMAAARHVGVDAPRISHAVHGLFAVDGLTAACAARGADANAVATVIADAMVAERTLMLPDGKGGVEPLVVPDHLVRLRAVNLLIEVELKLKALDQTVVEEEVGVRFDGVDLHALGRDELTALVMRRTTTRRPA